MARKTKTKITTRRKKNKSSRWNRDTWIEHDKSEKDQMTNCGLHEFFVRHTRLCKRNTITFIVFASATKFHINLVAHSQLNRPFQQFRLSIRFGAMHPRCAMEEIIFVIFEIQFDRIDDDQRRFCLWFHRSRIRSRNVRVACTNYVHC